MDLRHLVHEMMPKQEIAAPTIHRSRDARSEGILEMREHCSLTRMRSPSQQRAALLYHRRVQRREALLRAKIPHTGRQRRVGQRITRCKRSVAGAECKAHRGITEGNSHWANLLSFITHSTKHHNMESLRIPLTDIPTTWDEYQSFITFEASEEHLAFIYAIMENEQARHQHGPFETRNPPMFREDWSSHLSNCIPTVLSTMGGRNTFEGYQLPFEKTFDETQHKFAISSDWTLQQTDKVIQFAEQLGRHATACQEAIGEKGENDTKATLKICLPHLDLIIAKMICAQAAGIAGKLVSALKGVRKQKVAYAELIITCCIDVPINGQLFTLFNCDDEYLYISRDGNASIPY
jgi:hypothetical protein